MLAYERILPALSEFISTLLTPYDIDLVLGDLAIRIQEFLEIDGAGVSLAQDGKLRLATALPPEIKPLEETQVETQRGPCLDAYRSGKPVTVNDLREPQFRNQWPEYVTTANKLSIRAVAGVPMHVAENNIGAINLYSCKAKVWDELEIALAQIFANAATVFLVNASNYDQIQFLNSHLQRALDSRVLVEQAKGIIAEARGIHIEEAFEIIRGHARSRNASIRSVSEAIVNLGLRP